MKVTQLPVIDSSSSSRERMMQAAKHLFARKGFGKATTIEIVRLAGTSDSQLIKHFGSKEGLLEAIFNEGWSRIGSSLEQLDSLPSPRKKLEAIVQVMLTELNQDQFLKQLLLFEGRRIHKDGRLVLASEGFFHFVGKIDAVLAELRLKGDLHSGLNLRAVRSSLMGIMEGLLRDQILGTVTDYPAGFTDAEMLQTFNAFVSGLLVS